MQHEIGGYVARTAETRNVHKILTEKYEGKMPISD